MPEEGEVAYFNLSVQNFESPKSIGLPSSLERDVKRTRGAEHSNGKDSAVDTVNGSIVAIADRALDTDIDRLEKLTLLSQNWKLQQTYAQSDTTLRLQSGQYCCCLPHR